MQMKKRGEHLYLTATSTDELDRKVKKKEIIRYSLPRRFHGNPLVVPEIKWLPKIREKIEKGRIPYELLQLIKKQRQTHYPLLIFVSEIELGQQFTENLKILSQRNSRFCILTDNRPSTNGRRI